MARRITKYNVSNFPATGGIYRISCPAGSYVGASINLRSRLGAHITTLRSGTHKNKLMQSEFKLKGFGEFQIVLLEVCDNADLIGEREAYWIATLKPTLNAAKKPFYGRRVHEPYRNKIVVLLEDDDIEKLQKIAESDRRSATNVARIFIRDGIRAVMEGRHRMIQLDAVPA